MENGMKPIQYYRHKIHWKRKRIKITNIWLSWWLKVCSCAICYGLHYVSFMILLLIWDECFNVNLSIDIIFLLINFTATCHWKDANNLHGPDVHHKSRVVWQLYPNWVIHTSVAPSTKTMCKMENNSSASMCTALVRDCTKSMDCVKTTV